MTAVGNLKPTGVLARMGRNHSDNLQTPRWPIVSLLNTLPLLNGMVWEPACGKGRILEALKAMNQPAIGTDLLTGVNFLETTNPVQDFDYIITNPPFSLKDQFLAKCIEYHKPFALLMPLTALEGKTRQNLYRQNGIQVMVLPKRVDFEFPDGSFKGKPWFAGAWFTNGFNLPKDLMFIS